MSSADRIVGKRLRDLAARSSNRAESRAGAIQQRAACRARARLDRQICCCFN
jgi:hypothetical protein